MWALQRKKFEYPSYIYIYIYIYVCVCTVHNFCPDVYSSISEKLGKGVDLPRMKRAQLVNTVLKVEQVSICRRSHFIVGSCFWFLEEILTKKEVVVRLIIVFSLARDL